MKKIIYFLSVLLFLIIILSSFRSLVFNYDYYEKASENNQNFNKDQVLNLINYLKNKGELNNNFYSEKEIQHLKDVNSIISRLIILLFSLILIFLLLMMKFYKEVFKIFLISSLLVLVLVVILVSLNFSNLFYNFHLIFFNNDLWLLSPETTLIKLFPETFFYDFFREILLRSSLISLILLIVGLIGLYKKIQK